MILVGLSAAGVAAPALAAQQRYVYDEAGRLVQVTQEDGSGAIYEYDAVGNILSVKRISQSALSISEFTPNTGSSGTTVSIYGSGFIATPASNQVKFNGVSATVVSATSTALTVNVPAAATSGKISISNSNGAISSATDFVVGTSNLPTITSFSPAIGVRGTAVTINGANYAPVASGNRIAFDSVSASSTILATGKLGTTVPGVVSSGKISVTTAYGKATSDTDFFAVPPAINVADVEATGRLTVNAAPQPVQLQNVGKKALLLFEGARQPMLTLIATDATFAGSMSVSIYAVDGSVVLTSSLSNNGTLDLPMLPSMGTYTVALSLPSEAVGKVNLQLRAEDVGSSDIEVDGAARAISLSAGQNGRYTFAGKAGQRLSLGYDSVVTLPASQGIYYRVTNPDGSSLFGDSWSNSNSNNLPVLPVDGRYTIQVDPSGIATAKLNLVVSRDIVGSLALDAAPVTFSSTRVGQNGRYTFTGTAGQKLWVQMTAGTFTSGANASSASVYVLKPDGTSLTSSSVSTTGNFETGVLPVGGTYTVYVDMTGATIGKVDLQLVSIAADATGTVVVNGPPTNLTLSKRQHGVLTFAGVAGQRLSLGYTEVATVPAGQGIYYTVTKPDGAQLFGDSWTTNNSNNLPVLPVSGNYKINVEASGYTTATTAIHISTDLEGTLAIDAEPVTFSSNRIGQNGRYTFTGTAGQKLWVQMSGGTFTSGGSASSASVYILKPDGTTLNSSSVSTVGNFETGILPVGGTYTVYVDMTGATVGKVDLQLHSIAPDVTSNITVDGPSASLQLGIRQSGVLTFASTAGQRLSLGYSEVATVPASQSISYTVAKPDGVQLFGDSWSSNNSNDLPLLPVGGNYTVTVRANGEFQTAAKVTLTLSSEVTGTLAANVATPIQINRPGQNARFNFAGVLGQSYQLLLSAATFPTGASITVLNPDGNNVISTSISGATGTVTIPALATTGNHSVFISPYGSTNGQVTVQLK